MLSPERIKELVTSEILISPFNPKMLKAGSYSFTLGNKVRLLKSPRYIDLRSPEKWEVEETLEEIDISEKGYRLEPGPFVMCQTAETLTLGPNVGCILAMRGRMAHIGLNFLNGETFCEPGSNGCWDGKLFLATQNRGSFPIHLYPGVPVIKGIFTTFDLK